jgi:natural product biosynthesis luciferase-like monooxygenase protein/amino acid adenylation domain-containing protein/non-ribosomal peptide synthase protein (TIGR01720 family)
MRADVCRCVETQALPAAAPRAPARREPSVNEREPTGCEIAVIGMAGRFPGAPDLAAFWHNLRSGAESVRRFRADELEPSPFLPPGLRDHPSFVPAGAVLDPAFVDAVDRDLFGLSPREAAWADPQQRIILECALAALEDGGYDPARYAGRIAFYAGVGQSGHQLRLLEDAQSEPAALFEALSTAAAENTAMRVSYKLKLRGESMTVYTACSTGLVVVHMACQSLLLKQADMALAGAAKIAVPQRTGYLHQDGMIFSPDGRCRPFDHRAAGTVAGNGAGVVLLKPLADALRDGDHVYAVVLGSAVNNDADQKVGYTAPSVAGQADVIGQALAYSAVEPDTIGLVEAHGTGTPLGDPIEVAALTRTFRASTSRVGYCALGSVKANIGHLDTAAGMAGFIKAVLALHHRELPPTIHVERPNPALHLETSPFFVNTEAKPWPNGTAPRRAAVSSFGIGGTNAHAILEEAPALAAQPSQRRHHLVTLSARSAAALDAMASQLADHVEARPELDLADVAFTRNAGRAATSHRRALVADTREDLIDKLRAAGSHGVASPARRVALLFPGQGAQSAAMAGELYADEPVFRRALDECTDLARPELGLDLVDLLFLGNPVRADWVTDPELVLPALLAVEHGLAALWESWGLAPGAAAGHSFGEYAAALRAGVFELRDALRLAALRGRLMRRLPPGAMLAVGLGEEELSPLLPPALSLAAVNGRDRCTVSGPVDAIEAFERDLARRGVGALRLPARHAFHSPAVDDLVAELVAVVAGMELAPPRHPYVSCLTGTWVQPDEVTSPSYWGRQMREPVRFAAALDTLAQFDVHTFIEAGPDQALTALARAHFGPRSDVLAVPSLRRAGTRGSDRAVLLRSLGDLWTEGQTIDWDAHHAAERRRRVPLPAYPFERTPCRPSTAPAETSTDSAPNGSNGSNGSNGHLPLGEIESKIVEVWRERLGLAEVGRDDNFLELGGNSLVAAQALTRLRETFPVTIPLTDLFEAPTVAGLAARIEKRMREHEPAGDVELPPIEPIRRGESLPISAVQARVLTVAAGDPENPVLHMPIAIGIRGALDAGALERAIGAIVRRHEILRTSYRQENGRWIASAALTADVRLALLDLRGHAARERAMQEAREEAARPFDVGRAVMRATLVGVADDEHWLLLTIHHIACDTWSLVAFARELFALYPALRDGRPSPLPALAVQYADFAAWQERLLDSEVLDGQRTWWLEQLGDGPAPLGLPADRPEADSISIRGGRTRFRFSRRLTDAVHGFGEARGATPFMTILSAFAAVLARHSGQDDITVGTPFGNRSLPELEPLIGYVAHSLALRADLSGDPSFAEMVARVRETTLAAHAHPDVPYEVLVAQPERDGGVAVGDPGRRCPTSPLFDAVFVLQGALPAPVTPGLEIELVEVPDAPAQWGPVLAHLAISMGEDAGGLHGILEYDAARFDADTADRLIERMQRLLEAGLRRPETRLWSLAVATDEEERALGHRAPAAAPRGALDFSLSYFANDEDRLGGSKYELLVEGARFADRHGFAAVWTPERHFHPFGGLYPAPAVVAGAIAAITERVQIRAGSVVLPLHDPIRVAEEWAVVDNLSGGRVGVSFASGWHASDFVLAPERYAERKKVMLDGIGDVRALWRGEGLRRRGGTGQEVEVRLRPRPVQAELPFWLTAAASPDTFRAAGEMGGGVLTNLMGHTLDAVGEKVAVYRRAWVDAGHPGRGHVALMMHSFLGDDEETVRRLVREPLLRYFRSSVDIFASFAASQQMKIDVSGLTEGDIAALVEHGFDRYVETGGLFGTAATCQPVLRRLRDLDVDEVACLIDFGVELRDTLASLAHLAAVRADWSRAPATTVVPHEQLAGPVVVDAAGRPLPWGLVGRLRETGETARLRRDGTVERIAPPPRRVMRPATAGPRANTRARPAAIPVADRSRHLPLSFAQQRLWVLAQLDPSSAAYNNPVALRMTGRLDVHALQRAIDEVVCRHEVLRTRIAVDQGSARQEILASVRVPLERIDLGEVPEADREGEAMRRATREARRPFAVDAAPLMRALLFRLTGDHHVLLVTMHHIVSDGWSAGVLLLELGALYSAFSDGRASPLPDLPVQYADYAVWQRREQERSASADLAHWKERLALVPPLELPLDRPRRPVQSPAGARAPVSLGAPLTQALGALARQEGGTPFMAILAAFEAVLYRMSGQADFGVGTPVAGRSRPEVEPLVGCFVNTLVLRADLAGRPSFRELLRRVKGDALAAFAHQELPFERLVDELEVPRDLGVPALAQVMLVLHNTPAARADLPGLRLEGMEVDTGTSRFDLMLELRESAGELRGALEYNTDLFDPDTAARLVRLLETLVNAALAEPDRPIDDLPLLSDDERHRLLVEWNDTTRPYPSDRCLHELFEERAASRPDAIALSSPHEGVTLTYRELDQRADALADVLRERGVQPEDRIGLLLDRSAAFVIGVLAALKARAAYLPLDPRDPPERIAVVAADADARVFLARRESAEKLPSGATCLWADEWPSALPVRRAASRGRSSSDALAYVMYTSGSTGRPKGVAITHRAVVRLVRGAEVVPLGREDAMLFFAATVFDASTFEIWGSLLAGARLVVYPSGPFTAAELGAFLRRHHITSTLLTSGVYQLLADECLADLSGLTRLATGGDVMSVVHTRRVRDAFPDLRPVNVYGPTEAACIATTHQVEELAEDTARIPIGRPIGNTRVYVVDPAMQPAPIGVPGELLIGGDALGRGYAGRPDLTAAAFIPDPFGPRGGRLYRSGDRARWRPDGTLDFLGRIDQQVKVRGYRIELGEIEAALAAHPDVRDCAAVARTDGGERRIAAYLVTDGGPESPLDPGELRAFLKDRLPDWMVPYAFVNLAALPLTPAGKVDRRALPAPERRTSRTAPRNESEETLAAVWADVLRLDEVGVHENFFEVGGDSILSLRVIARARERGIALTPRQMFQHQTVAEQVAAAGTAPLAAAEQGIVSGPVPLTPVQRWFVEQDLPNRNHFNLSTLFATPAPLDPDLVERALRAVVLHHDALRLRLRLGSDGWMQDIAAPDDEPILCAGTPDELQASLDLERGPLLRAAQLEAIDGTGRLLLAIHHMAVDPVSLRILFDDLARALTQLQRGEPLRLPEKTTSFKTWSERLTSFALTDELARELPFWEAQHADRVAGLPIDLGSGGNREASTGRLTTQLGEAETRALLAEVHSVSRTQVAELLLTSLARVLGRWAGGPALLIDLEGHGREPIQDDLDLSRTVGWFTAQHPVRLDIPPGSAVEALAAVAARLREVPRGGVGYGALRYLSPHGERLAAIPAPEVSFNYLGQFDFGSRAGLLRVTDGERGAERSPRGRRSHLLEVDAAVIDGRLHVIWSYSCDLHRAETIEKLAESFQAELRELMELCRSSTRALVAGRLRRDEPSPGDPKILGRQLA